jgi:hypothetical protein
LPTKRFFEQINTFTLFDHMHKSITNIALYFAVAGLLVVQGCGHNPLGTVRVSGTVTLDGNPAAGVNVSFIPAGGEGRETFGITDAQGRFVLTTPGTNTGSGAIPGEYHVMLSKWSDPLAGINLDGKGVAEAGAEIRKHFPRGIPSPENVLPAKYADRNATDIAPVTVERRGRNNLTFNLVSQ